MNLRKLEINAFRGATRPLVLEFEPGKAITLIFGENGSGKSTIGDALVCLCTGELGSIKDKSGTDATALPSLGQDPASMLIRLHTDAGVFSAQYANKKIVKSPATGQPALRVIRRQHIVELANAAPADRYRHLREYVDVDAIEMAGVGNAYPSASALVELAQPRALREEFVQPSELQPLYLRKSDAEINWDLRESGFETEWTEQAGR